MQTAFLMYISTSAISRIRTISTFATLCLMLAACKRPVPESVEGATATEDDTNLTLPMTTDPTLPTTTLPTTGGGDDPVWAGCLKLPMTGFSAFQHQCGGSGTALLHFNIVGTGSNDGPQTFGLPVNFGPGEEGDSYEKPKVMACCAPGYDDEEDLVFQPHYLACYHDLAEQACLSLWTQLNEIKDRPETPVLAKPQIQSLANFVAEHQQDCYNEMWAESGAVGHVPANATDFFTLNHVWDLGGGAETNNIKDIEFEIVSGVVDQIFIPENSATWSICDSGFENNPYTFIQADPSDGHVFSLYYGDAELLGPGTPAYQGSGDFASASSFISTDETEVGVWVHGMTLDAAEPVVVTNGTSSTTVEVARIDLYENVHASAVGSLLFEIPPGGAMFVVTGSVNGETSIETLYNASTIELEMEPPTLLDPIYSWTVTPFDLVYEDANEDEWTLEIGTLFFNP